jgi:hypothetical protein
VAGSVGPELPTLAEKFVRLLRLPYFWGCVVWALVLLEIPILLDRFLSNHDPLGGQEALYYLIVFIMSVYFPLSVRFVRARVLEAEAILTPLMPGGEEDYHEAFNGAISYRGQIITIGAIVLMAVYVIIQTNSLVYAVIISICAAYIAFMLGSLIWIYLGCIIGLYRLGGKPLKFKAFREDPKLGTKPIGLLSLSLAGAYFAGVVLLILFSAVSPNQLYKIPYLFVIYAVLILVGLAMFFLPLFKVHFRMAEEKTKQDLQIQRNFDCTSHDLKSKEGEDPLVSIRKLLSLDMADRKLQAISTWPFDTSLLGRLLTILLAVTAALIAKALPSIFGWWGA